MNTYACAPDEFVRSGYEVYTTTNGGFIVRRSGVYANGDYRTYSTDSASFSNKDDYLKWVVDAHEQFAQKELTP